MSLYSVLERAHERWLSTCSGYQGPGDDVFTAHPEDWRIELHPADSSLSARFARDAAAVEGSWQFDRLHGVKQSIPFPPEGARTRWSHSRNVATLAREMAAALCLNTELAYAVGIAHDCGHPPGAHTGEAVMADELGEWDHCVNGAVMLKQLSLHPLVVDGVVCHSWGERTPLTSEAQLVSFADRIEYATADLFDSLVIGADWSLSEEAWAFLGRDLVSWQRALVEDVVSTSHRSGYVSISRHGMTVLRELREECNRAVYSHPLVVDGCERIGAAVRSLIVGRGHGSSDLQSRHAYVCSLTDLEAITAASES